MSSPHDNLPMCELCHCQLTVKHVLTVCPKYDQYRRVFKNRTLSGILSENVAFSFYSILWFLKQTNLLDKI